MEKEVKELAEQFKKRYNRDVRVFIDQEHKNNKLTKVRARIVHKNKEFTIEEHLDENQLTKYVFVEFDGKTHKYNRYLDAEISVADCIGE